MSLNNSDGNFCDGPNGTTDDLIQNIEMVTGETHGATRGGVYYRGGGGRGEDAGRGAGSGKLFLSVLRPSERVVVETVRVITLCLRYSAVHSIGHNSVTSWPVA